jgi:uncharacterized protein
LRLTVEKFIDMTLRKFFHLGIIKIIIGLVVCGGVAVGTQILLGKILSSFEMEAGLTSLIVEVSVAVMAVVSYSLLFSFYENRKIEELSIKNIGRHLLFGALLGAMLQVLTVLVIYLSKSYEVVAVNAFTFIVPALAMSFTSAVVEEILVRGIVFRIIEEKLGSYLAISISAVLFGAMHLANPNSSLLMGLALAIQAGALLAAAYIFSRSLWFPIALHFAWNFVQAGIFGANVSGNAVSKSFITSHISGPEWITGGEFGPEGSVQATLFCLLAVIALLYLSHQKGAIIKPWFARLPK